METGSRGLKATHLLSAPMETAAAGNVVACTGDCDRNGRNEINEIVTCVRHALDALKGDLVCVQCDHDRDGTTQIGELIATVGAALFSPVFEADGRCLRPCRGGSCTSSEVTTDGLVPCITDGVVIVSRCREDATCDLTPGEARVTKNGAFEVAFPTCALENALPELRAGETDYRIIDLGGEGAGGGAQRLNAVNSPISEATTRLLDTSGVLRFDSVGIAVQASVAEALREADFREQDDAGAAEMATAIARMDPSVHGTVDVNLMPTLRIGNAAGSPGSMVDIAVSLSTGGETEIAGTQNDILVVPLTAIRARPNGRPDCQPNATIGKNGTAFGFLPAGCTRESCTAMRAALAWLGNTDPTPNRSIRYSRSVAIASGATGSMPLGCMEALVAPTTGGSMPVACAEGTVT